VDEIKKIKTFISTLTRNQSKMNNGRWILFPTAISIF